MSGAEERRLVAREAAARPAEPRGDGWRTAILMIAATLPFLPGITGPFVFDDARLLGAPCVTDPAGLARIWASEEPLDYWPLSYTLFWLEWRLFAGWPPGYHAVSILLHAGCCLLLWRLLAVLHVAWAWQSAVLFAVHPVTVGAVAFAAQQKTLLAALLGLASVSCHAEWMSSGRSARRWASLALAAAALLAKTTAVAIPPVLVLLTRWQTGRWWCRQQLATLPAFALAAACGVLGVWFKGTHGQETGVVGGGMLVGIVTAAEAFWFYLAKAVWPHPLLFLYPLLDTDSPGLGAAAAVASLAVGVGLLLVVRSQAGLAVSTCLLVYLAGLAPALYFKAFLRFWQFHVADYYQYPALAAVMVLAAAGFATAAAALPAWRQGVWAGYGAVVVLLAAATGVQATLYRDPAALYAHSLAHGARSAVAANNLGRLWLDRGAVAEAIPLFRSSLEIAPANREAVNNLVEALLVVSRPDDARTVVRQFVALYGEDADTLAWEGVTLARLDPVAAERLYRRALALDPRHVHARTNLGNALVRQGRLEEAVMEYRRALRLDPGNAAARANLRRLTSGQE
jgi:protein O-mannosyl-transferase